MPPEDRDLACLWDMLQAARNVLQFTAGRGYDEYTKDDLLQAAVERKIEIIGEAARGLSDGFRAAHTKIPWQGIVAQRHKLAHEYSRVEHDRIWRVVTTHIPELIRELEGILPPPPADPEPDAG